MNDFKDKTSAQLLDIILHKFKQEPEISALRQRHYNLTGLMLHESDVEYGKLTIAMFWYKITDG